MHWEKKSLIYKPNGEFGWMNSHAQGSTPVEFEDIIRIYFASRPNTNLTLPTYIDVDKDNFGKVLKVNEKPLLKLGSPGTFDEHGIIPSTIIRIDNKFYLYYIGWSRKHNTPYTLNIGLAISIDGHTFGKYSDGPILGIEKNDAFSLTAPTVFFENGLYQMFYTAGTGWHMIDNRWEHTYTIRRAWSKDGIQWKRDFINIIEPKNELECISCPAIIKSNNVYHMWYSYKGSVNFRNNADLSYRIGYATSIDMIKWVRQDENAGIDVSPDGWDSEMIEYPNLFESNGSIYLFYNGNGFGASGFGYAKLIMKS